MLHHVCSSDDRGMIQRMVETSGRVRNGDRDDERGGPPGNTAPNTIFHTDSAISTNPGNLTGATAFLANYGDPAGVKNGDPVSRLLDTAIDAFVEVNDEGVVLEWNSHAEELFGWERGEVLGHHVQGLIVPARYRSAYNDEILADAAKMADRGRGEIVERRLVLRKKDGTEIEVLTRSYATKDGDAIRIGGFIRDMSSLRAMEERLAAAHLRDQLTGLPNRAYLTYQLNYALARNSTKAHGDPEAGMSVAVVAVDMDGFTAINDAYGQEVGDEVLIAASKRLATIAGKNILLGRFGADEFVACIDRAGAIQAAEDFALKAIEVFGEPISTSMGDLYVGVSVGIGTATVDNLFGSSRNGTTVTAVKPGAYGSLGESEDSGGTGRDHAVDASLLFSSADAAMQNAKKSSLKSYVVFGEKMREEVVERMDTQMALHRAIGMEELRLFYQPVVDARGRKVVGVEALIRWEHPVKGMVSPDRFIPVAEESGLVIPIGKWVLEKACDSFALWDSPPWRWSGECQAVSVNLSVRQINSHGLVDAIEEILDSSGVAPGRVTLEITESALMKDADAALSVIQALKSLGVTLSIDDFGTGYSSLAYLQRFPLDVLKIDKSFIDDLGTKEESAYLVKAIIDVACALKLEVVAEGVETDMQLEMLQDLGCDLIQGFLFSKPMPAERLVEEFSLPAAVPSVVAVT